MWRRRRYGEGDQEFAECELNLGNRHRAEKLQKSSVSILEKNHGEDGIVVAQGAPSGLVYTSQCALERGQSGSWVLWEAGPSG